MEAPTGKTGIIYCRVSSLEQVDGTSLGSQERMCREFAAKQGIEVLETFIEKAQKGDREAYGSLYKKFYPRIFRYCRINLFNKFIPSLL